MATLEVIFADRRKKTKAKKSSHTMLTLVTLLLWISPGLGEDKPPDCGARDPRFCSSPCAYLRDRCNGSKDCFLDLCSYLHPPPHPHLQRCWDLFFECTDDYRAAAKRGILNKDMAYLLLKLHPFVNQTSQFGFLTSGRFRRISGNLGTEFLGKRGNNKPNGRTEQNRTKSKLPTPQFYSLPLNKFSKTKILKRKDEFQGTEKRVGVRENGRVVVGSEFLGKRADGRTRAFAGTELLGKRDSESFDGSEFLGKRAGTDYLGGNEFLGKRDQEELLEGSELLGKKSERLEYPLKRFGNELLGKRFGWQELNSEPQALETVDDYRMTATGGSGSEEFSD